MAASKRHGEGTISSEKKLDSVVKRQRIQEENSPGEPSPKNTLYVHNLNDKVRIKTMRENLYLFFSTYGEVLQISMSPKLRGQAFVVLRSVDEANLARLSLQGDQFFGKPVHIQFSKHNTKSIIDEQA
ncbi:LAFE_0F05468g1_1 [Lachancea fermentati]|uniref:LAFE_0F05468g1_1 n=1 Tax=Lachancea fermentati TaxID=4955 RepID=A0A1G4MEP1_LACFM|nr:LAFE_0F05468g1_1 [Lachancea fermentati]